MVRIPADDVLAEAAGPLGEPQAGATADAADGAGGDLPEAEPVAEAPSESGLPLPAAANGDRPAQPGLGDAYHVPADPRRLRLPLRRDRLVQSGRPGV